MRDFLNVIGFLLLPTVSSYNHYNVDCTSLVLYFFQLKCECDAILY